MRVVAERLEALVEALCIETGYERVHVIGHSMGAFIGLEAAATLGDRIASLVVMGLGAAMPVHPALQTAADDDDPGRIRELLAQND